MFADPLSREWHLKSPTVIADLSTSPFSFISFCFTYFVALLFDEYKFRNVMSSQRIDIFVILQCPSAPGNFLCPKVYFTWYQYCRCCLLFANAYMMYFSIFLLLTWLYCCIWREFLLDSIQVGNFKKVTLTIYLNWCCI